MDTPEKKTPRRQWEERTLDPHLKKYPDREADYSTISSLPVERLYSPEDLAGTDFERDIAWPGEYPYTRGVQPSMYRGRLWTMRMFAGMGTAEDTNERFKYLLHHGQTGLSHGLRPAHAHGPRQRQPAGGRRGGQGGRGGRHPARHGDPLRRHPPGRRLHLHDDQRPGGRGLRHVPGGGREAGRALQEAARHHPERHLQGVHRPEGVDLSSRALRAPHRGHHGVLGAGSARSGTPSPSAATTSARRAPRRRRSWPSRSPTASATSRRGSSGACRWTTSPRA